MVELKFWDEGAAAAQNVHRREDKVTCDGPDKCPPGHRADAEVCSAKEPSREDLTEVIGHGSDGGDEEFLASVERAHHEAADKETPLRRQQDSREARDFIPCPCLACRDIGCREHFPDPQLAEVRVH